MNSSIPPLDIDFEDDDAALAAKILTQPAWLGMGFVVLLAVLFVPLWIMYLTWTWQDGHYQYFPLLILIIGGLYWSRISEAQIVREDAAPRTVRIATFCLLFLAVLAHLLFSSFLVSLANIVLLSTATYFFFGGSGLKYFLPVIGLLFFVVPLPVGLDSRIIFEMQFLASRLASLMLDGAGVMHVREGVVLVTEKSHFMTEEACSGIRSLFSSLAIVAVYSVAARHFWPRVIVNLIQTVVWVLIINSVRVALTVVLADHVDPWFATGTGHEIFSLVMFGMILLMVSSTDQITGRLGSLHYPAMEEDLDRKALQGRLDGESIAPIRRFSLNFPRRHAIVVTSVLFVCTLVGIRTTIVRQAETAGFVASLPRLPVCRDDDLPILIGAWQKVTFNHLERDPSALFSRDSFRWIYQDGSMQAIISVDCPWAEWHNLNVCYTAIGWRSKPQYFLESPDGVPFAELTYSDLELDRNKESFGRVYFTSVDRQRRDLGPGIETDLTNIESLFRNLLTRMASSLGLGSDRRLAMSGVALPATTIQILSEQPEKYSDEELTRLRALFFRARAMLLESPRWKEA